MARSPKKTKPAAAPPRISTLPVGGGQPRALPGIDRPRVDPQLSGGTGDMPGLSPDTDWSRPR